MTSADSDIPENMKCVGVELYYDSGDEEIGNVLVGRSLDDGSFQWFFPPLDFGNDDAYFQFIIDQYNTGKFTLSVTRGPWSEALSSELVFTVEIVYAEVDDSGAYDPADAMTSEISVLLWVDEPDQVLVSDLGDDAVFRFVSNQLSATISRAARQTDTNNEAPRSVYSNAGLFYTFTFDAYLHPTDRRRFMHFQECLPNRSAVLLRYDHKAAVTARKYLANPINQNRRTVLYRFRYRNTGQSFTKPFLGRDPRRYFSRLDPGNLPLLFLTVCLEHLVVASLMRKNKQN